MRGTKTAIERIQSADRIQETDHQLMDLTTLQREVEQLKQDRDHLDEQYRQLLPVKNQLQGEVESLRGQLERKAQESFSLSGTVETWKEACEVNQEALSKANTALQKAKGCIAYIGILGAGDMAKLKEGALAAIEECL